MHTNWERDDDDDVWDGEDSEDDDWFGEVYDSDY